MARFLLAWEIGQNYGHVAPLLPIARSLRSAGHEIIFALKDIGHAAALAKADGFRILQAPAYPDAHVPPSQPPPESMADILALFGFADADMLSRRLRAWRQMMQRLQPDVVVASYAPTALLAARTLSIRTAVVGTAFEVPPPMEPLPSMRNSNDGTSDRLRLADASVVAGVSAAIAPYGRSVTAAHEVFSADLSILWTFPEMDPARQVRARSGTRPSYCGAIFNADVGIDLTWHGSHERRVLGYVRLRGDDLARLVQALAPVDAEFRLVVPDVNQETIDRLRRPNVELIDRPAKLSSALQDAQCLLSYGGHGTVCAALLAGVPLVLFPNHLEAWTIARQAERIGAARLVAPLDFDGVAKACASVVGEEAPRRAARRFARRYLGFDPPRQAGRVARMLVDLAG